jgi:hypothetical protein
MWMGDQPGNTVDKNYLPAWQKLFEDNNGFIGTPYAKKYPELLNFFEENHYFPAKNFFEKNLVWNPELTRASSVNQHGARDVKNLLNYAGNWVADRDPGFTDWRAGDFSLTADAEVFQRIPGFKAVPFAEIGTHGKIGLPGGPDRIELTACCPTGSGNDWTLRSTGERSVRPPRGC